VGQIHVFKFDGYRVSLSAGVPPDPINGKTNMRNSCGGAFSRIQCRGIARKLPLAEPPRIKRIKRSTEVAPKKFLKADDQPGAPRDFERFLHKANNG
jgi:hypothetical protein